ncbi:DUF427 domain-containing protein [Exilibacterium tricleocarpae]|uniref:DUF427 domain-containing protein n=1 Tax=Exilibacterium tricleocarpae TaxID=2591008 RepID=A0A545TK73_9GAMM|nr:DUF427 domain-containing protein [Exilibacterium tricleocarpae]TQV77607.1 DUF427 domain-containing protein [Exilibacterium tricleocarpae]
MTKVSKRENVWDYPRPAICEPFKGALTVKHDGLILARTTHAYRTLETSHPPTYYFPPQDVNMDILKENDHQTFCEWKGIASYFDLQINGKVIMRGAWTYQQPSSTFSAIKDHVSFYASKVDACFVNEEQVIAQAGDFYGGWITSNIEGPFKGAPGTSSW